MSLLKTAHVAYDLSSVGANAEGLFIHQGSIYFGLHNVSLNKPGGVGRITPDGKVEKVFDLPLHADGKRPAILGVAVGSDGNVYLADCQFTDTCWGGSCLWRIVHEAGVPVRAEIVATGLNYPNGIAVKGDNLYVSDTIIKREGTITTSGVIRFNVQEFKKGSPVHVEMKPSDPHYLCELTTDTTQGGFPYGANGITFDDGNTLYITDFGTCHIWKVVLGADDQVLSCASVADTKPLGFLTLDGAHYDAQEKVVWFADPLGNSIGGLRVATGEVFVLARGGGSLDLPTDVARLGDKLYIISINIDFGPHKATSEHVMSVIKM
jgi:sugar lactone lactonase YvrE